MNQYGMGCNLVSGGLHVHREPQNSTSESSFIHDRGRGVIVRYLLSSQLKETIKHARV